MNGYINTPWLVVRQPNRWAEVRLFCFPYSGAGASIYNGWVEQLPYHVELCAVQAPGRENRLAEPLFSQLPPLVDAITLALKPYLDKPFVFFGHSLGALVSFEVARRLRRQQGLSPRQLFAAGHGAPQLPRERTPIHDLPDDAFAEELRRYNGTPEEVLAHPELRQLLFPILRADFAAYETYVYTPDEPLSCPITVFGGEQDEVSRTQLEGWRVQTTSTFAVEMLPGDHFFLNSARTELLQKLVLGLRKVSRNLALQE